MDDRYPEHIPEPIDPLKVITEIKPPPHPIVNKNIKDEILIRLNELFRNLNDNYIHAKQKYDEIMSQPSLKRDEFVKLIYLPAYKKNIESIKQFIREYNEKHKLFTDLLLPLSLTQQRTIDGSLEDSHENIPTEIEKPLKIDEILNAFPPLFNTNQIKLLLQPQINELKIVNEKAKESYNFIKMYDDKNEKQLYIDKEYKPIHEHEKKILENFFMLFKKSYQVFTYGRQHYTIKEENLDLLVPSKEMLDAIANPPPHMLPVAPAHAPIALPPGPIARAYPPVALPLVPIAPAHAPIALPPGPIAPGRRRDHDFFAVAWKPLPGDYDENYGEEEDDEDEDYHKKYLKYKTKYDKLKNLKINTNSFI